MTTSDYLIDSALLLLVLLQVRERRLTIATLLRPLVLVGAAAANYLHGIPTAGNDLVLVGTLAVLGTVIGVASGATIIMRRDPTGRSSSAPAGRRAPCGSWGWGHGSRSSSGSPTAARPPSGSSAPPMRSPAARPGPRLC